MPENALPQPWTVVRNAIHWRKEYRDALGRPLTGTMRLVGSARHDLGDLTIIPTPMTVSVRAGVVALDLPPDTYTYTATLKSQAGETVKDQGEFTLQASSTE